LPVSRHTKNENESGSIRMNCIEVTKKFRITVTGRSRPKPKSRSSRTLRNCQACQAELAAHRKFLELLDERDAVADAGLLVQCRSDLNQAIRRQIAAEAGHGAGWRGWHSAMQHLRDLRA